MKVHVKRMIIQVTPNNKSDLFCPQINSQCEVIISSIKTKIHGSTSRFVSTKFTFYSEHPKHTQQHIKQVKANANMIKVFSVQGYGRREQAITQRVSWVKQQTVHRIRRSSCVPSPREEKKDVIKSPHYTEEI